jgi:hypothetical protein
MSAWTGGITGAVLGGVVAFIATKMTMKHPDVAIIGAATGAGFLIGGAVTAAPVGPQVASAPLVQR